MVYSLVGLLSARRVGRVSSIIELAVDEDGLNNVFSDLSDKSTVIVEAFAKILRGFGKKLAMEVSSYVRNPVGFEISPLWACVVMPLVMCSSVACPLTHVVLKAAAFLAIRAL